MSKGMAIIGIVIGGIIAGALTGGAAFVAAGGMAALAAGAAGTAALASATSAALIWGSVVGVLTTAGGVLSTVSSWSGSGSSISNGSPTYSWGKLQTQTSNCLAIPIIYGEVKVAGNTIWQAGAGTTTLQKIIALADGEIEAITDVKINNKAIGSLPGCNHNAYAGTSTQLIDSRVTGANNVARAEKVGGLRNTAYIALTAKASAELSGGVNLTTVVKGSKVKGYSDLENFILEYSNNPAWCILDFLTRYNGNGIPIEEIDLHSFIDAAAYCDEEVGEGDKKQKRFTLNIVLDEKKSRLDWLENMLITCRGYTFYQNGKLALQIEKAENSMQLFDKDNILAGSEKFRTTPREKKTDIFKVQYIDPNNEYARIFAHAEADEFENEQPVVQEIQAWGVTNFNQASRLAWYYLNQAKTCNKFISFSTSQEGLDRTIGDVIEVTSTFLGYEEKKMRIVNMAEAQEGQIEIVCKEYNEALYSDQLGSAEPVANTINLPSALDTPPTVQNLIADENCWRTPEGNYVSTIKITWDELDYFHLSHYEVSYSCDEDETWSQGNVSYDGSFVIENTQIDKEYLIKVHSVTRREIFSEPAEASVLTVGKNNPPARVPKFIVTQKNDYLKAIITPPDDEDISHYEIRLGADWETAEFVLRTIETSALFRPTKNGTVSYLVKAIDNVGNYSEHAARFVLNVLGVTPKNIIIEQTFTEDDFTFEGDEIILPLMDMGVNFQDFRVPKETRLIVDCPDATEIQYRHAFSEFNGWDYLEFADDDETTGDNWEDEVPPVWSDWKSYTQEPEFCGQYVQVKLKGENISEVKVTADIDDVEDFVSNIDIPAEATTVTLNKNFTVTPVIIPTTVDATGKVCSWRVSNVDLRCFDIELLDNEDNIIAGKLLSAAARGY
ncbi:MAG: hypothetical protein LBK53_09265 [Heliobacteriaceae bacterium]|jgi:hypothetical protein|nr:hypothetical protein [Heliobacteriaceae bacterium]